MHRTTLPSLIAGLTAFATLTLSAPIVLGNGTDTATILPLANHPNHPPPVPVTTTPLPTTTAPPTEEEPPAKDAPNKRASGPKITLWEPGSIIFERPGPYTGTPTTTATSATSSSSSSADKSAATGAGFALTVTVTVVTQTAAAAATAPEPATTSRTITETSAGGYLGDTAVPASSGLLFSWVE